MHKYNYLLHTIYIFCDDFSFTYRHCLEWVDITFVIIINSIKVLQGHEYFKNNESY